MVNFREGWKGHLWQERFASFPADNAYALQAARYIELNPVRAGLVEKPEEYRWSSARAHILGLSDPLLKTQALLSLLPSWKSFLDERVDKETMTRMHTHSNTGRPLGNDDFIATVEHFVGRLMRPQKPGRKPNPMK